jgi:hypothetical protein
MQGCGNKINSALRGGFMSAEVVLQQLMKTRSDKRQI